MNGPSPSRSAGSSTLPERGPLPIEPRGPLARSGASAERMAAITQPVVAAREDGSGSPAAPVHVGIDQRSC